MGIHVIRDRMKRPRVRQCCGLNCDPWGKAQVWWSLGSKHLRMWLIWKIGSLRKCSTYNESIWVGPSPYEQYSHRKKSNPGTQWQTHGKRCEITLRGGSYEGKDQHNATTEQGLLGAIRSQTGQWKSMSPLSYRINRNLHCFQSLGLWFLVTAVGHY